MELRTKPNDFKLAIACLFIDSNVRKNGENIRHLMTQAKAAGAQLVHFTEGALSGYVKAQIKSWDNVDWGIVDDELQKICEHAGEIRIHVVVGCNHRIASGPRPRNSLLVISDHGEIVARYDKRFCSHTEITDWYSAGHLPCVFEVDGWRFGCALCIEIHFAELFLEYETLNVDCVLWSTYGIDPMHWVQAQGHAAGNNFWISVATPAQCNSATPGGLIGPHGGGLNRITPQLESGIEVSILDRRAPEFDIAINKARPWRKLARSGNIYAK